MSTDREALGRFLTDNAVNETALALVRPACDLIAPFFIAAESGSLTLSPVAAIDETAEAIALASGAEIADIIPVSLSAVTEASSWLIRGSGQPAAETALWSRVARSLREAVDAAHWSVLQKRLPGWLAQELNETLAAAVWQDLQPILMARLPEYAALAYWDSFMITLGYVLIGDADGFHRMAPLLDKLSQNIPLGEKGGEPGTWLVLTA